MTWLRILRAASFSRQWGMMTNQLTRVSQLANRLAARTLAAFEQGELTDAEFKNSSDVVLVLKAAKVLEAKGADLPHGIGLLAAKAQQIQGQSPPT
jgi:hypothetical protein